MKIHRFKRCQLSKSNSFDQNFMKLFTLFSPMMSSSSLIMVYMAPYLRSYCPKFVKNHRLKRRLLSNMNSFDQNFMKLGHIIKYHNVFEFQNGPYRIMPSGVIALC